MSTRLSGTHYDNHWRAAELHDAAAHAHRAAGNHDQEDHLSAHELSRQALQLAQEAHHHARLTATPSVGHGIAAFGHHEIAVRAHELWLERGAPEGTPHEDWFQATGELRARAAAAGSKT